MSLLDFIFPKRCVVCGEYGTYLCKKDKTEIKWAETFCPVCLKPSISGTTHPKCKKKLSLDGLICLFDYTRPIKQLTHQLKYRFVKDLVTVIESEIKKVKVLKEIDFHSYTLLPVPLSGSRKNWRGFNQAEILGETAAKFLKIPYDSEILTKIKDTKPQAKLPRKERLTQLKGAFKARTDTVYGGYFLVFDDVWTTGATLKAAAAALKRKGAAKVWGLTLATSHKMARLERFELSTSGSGGSRSIH